MMKENKEQIVDVGSVVEAVSADDGDAPLYSLESLCMRCGENVISSLPSFPPLPFSLFLQSIQFRFLLLFRHVLFKVTRLFNSPLCFFLSFFFLDSRLLYSMNFVFWLSFVNAFDLHHL